MELQPTLESHLVKIRPMKEDDLEALFEVAKDPKIWEQHPSKRYLRTEFEKFFKESIESNGALIILDKSTGAIIGTSRYKKVEGFPKWIEIGWTFISRQYWGGKYNGEIKQLMMEHAFRYMEVIIFFIDKYNFRSQKAVEKIGGHKIVESAHKNLLKTSKDNLAYIIKKTI